jgi:hypothetical protein
LTMTAFPSYCICFIELIEELIETVDFGENYVEYKEKVNKYWHVY